MTLKEIEINSKISTNSNVSNNEDRVMYKCTITFFNDKKGLLFFHKEIYGKIASVIGNKLKLTFNYALLVEDRNWSYEIISANESTIQEIIHSLKNYYLKEPKTYRAHMPVIEFRTINNRNKNIVHVFSYLFTYYVILIKNSNYSSYYDSDSNLTKAINVFLISRILKTFSVSKESDQVIKDIQTFAYKDIIRKKDEYSTTLESKYIESFGKTVEYHLFESEMLDLINENIIPYDSKNKEVIAIGDFLYRLIYHYLKSIKSTKVRNIMVYNIIRKINQLHGLNFYDLIFTVETISNTKLHEKG